MTQATPLNEASKILCRLSLKLRTAAKAMRLESKEAREVSAAHRLQRKNYWVLDRIRNSIRLKLFLDNDSYECLLNHVAPGLIRAAILEAVLLGNARVVDCDDVQARELLVCARSHCPGAVDRIAEAFRAAGIKI